MKMIWMAVLCVCLANSPVFGGINLKNGNFVTTYLDIKQMKGGHELTLSRSYNSRSDYKGWFGYGWGSTFETYITVNADGSVMVHEFGGGAKTRFTPPEGVDGYNAAAWLLDRGGELFSGSDEAFQYRTQRTEELAGSFALREEYAESHHIQKTLAAGTVLYSHVRGNQKLTKTTDGYERQLQNRSIEVFDDRGRLIGKKGVYGYQVDFFYAKNGQLETVRDNRGNQLFFAWHPDGLLQHVWSAGYGKAEYRYQDGLLIYSRDTAGNEYGYEYDPDRLLTAVGKYDDDAIDKQRVEYTANTRRVAKIIEEDGAFSSYAYVFDAGDRNHYRVDVQTGQRSSGDQQDYMGEKVESFDYYTAAADDGYGYIRRVIIRRNGREEETLYLPTGQERMTRCQDELTLYRYNELGLLVEQRSTSGKFTLNEYRDATDLIVKVTKNDGWANYGYDEQDGLVHIEKSDGQKAAITYNDQGLMTAVTTNMGDEVVTLQFSNNVFGNPSRVSVENGGEINIEYDDYGKMTNMTPNEGDEVVETIFSVFESILGTAQDAGVNL
jgi:YD repeat-containing protein